MPYLKERTYVNADRSKVVSEDSADAAYLLGGEGDEVTADDAKRLKLSTADEAPQAQPAQQPAESQEPETAAAGDAAPRARKK